MQKFYKTRLATIIITALVVALVSSVVAFAAGSYSKPVAASATVVTANPEIAVFSDAACTVPVTEIAFGNVVQGESSIVTVYLKNVGNKNLTSPTVTNTFDPAIATLTNSTILSLPKGNTSTVTLTLTAKADGAPGAITPVISFNATY